MIEFIETNWAIVFSGVGTAVVVAVLTHFLRRRNVKNSITLKQNAQAGQGSKIVQAGRDASVGSHKQD